MHTSFSSFQFATSSLFLVHFFLSNFKCLHFSRVGSKCFSPLNLYSFSKQYHAHQMLPSSTILMAQTVKRLSTMWETWVRSLGWEVPWRRKWQPTRVLACRIPGTGEPGGVPSMGSHRVGHDWSDLANRVQQNFIIFCRKSYVFLSWITPSSLLFMLF